VDGGGSGRRVIEVCGGAIEVREVGLAAWLGI
jgi:hypothetical protein